MYVPLLSVAKPCVYDDMVQNHVLFRCPEVLVVYVVRFCLNESGKLIGYVLPGLDFPPFLPPTPGNTKWQEECLPHLYPVWRGQGGIGSRRLRKQNWCHRSRRSFLNFPNGLLPVDSRIETDSCQAFT